MLLAPASGSFPDSFRSVRVDGKHHAHMLTQVQRLRGKVYLDDGAISRAQLSPDGRHIQETDRHSWHVMSVQPDGTVTGCARLRPHPVDVTPEDLGVWQAAIANDPAWTATLRQALTNEIDLARQRDRSYVELGGWAVAATQRGTMHAFETAVAAYALASDLGGCVGITTATVRHCSARILRKLGGQPLEVGGVTLPTYFDPRYGCEMEILRFESGTSHTLNRRLGGQVDRIVASFRQVQIIASEASMPSAIAARAAMPTMETFAERYLPAFVPQNGYAAAL